MAISFVSIWSQIKVLKDKIKKKTLFSEPNAPN